MVLTRRQFIEQFRRQIYNGQPASDATITVQLVNTYLNDAVAVAAKSNYTDSLKLDGIAYVNNSFYTTYKALAVVKDDVNLWQITLPDIPVGIGYNEGVETLVFKDSDSNQLSLPIVWLSQNQKSYQRGMRLIANKTLGYIEGKYVYVMSTIFLSQYTAQVTMISGGNSTDLDSSLNVPGDYLPVMRQYLQQQLLLEKAQPLDNTNDGVSFTTTT